MTLKFGELEKVATDDGFIWYAEVKLMSENFGQVLFCLVSTDGADVDDETTASRTHRPRYRPIHKRGACLFKR